MLTDTETVHIHTVVALAEANDVEQRISWQAREGVIARHGDDGVRRVDHDLLHEQRVPNVAREAAHYPFTRRTRARTGKWQSDLQVSISSRQNQRRTSCAMSRFARDGAPRVAHTPKVKQLFRQESGPLRIQRVSFGMLSGQEMMRLSELHVTSR